MLNPKWLLVLFLCCYIQFSLQQIPEGTPCYTPRNEYGLCVNIKKCVVLIELLRTQSSNESVRNYLRTSTCGYEGTTPMVCCPQTTSKSNPKLTEFKGDSNENTSAESTTTKSEDDTRQGREKEAVLPISPECGFSNVTNSRVVGGMPAALGEFPWIVALGYRNPTNNKQPKWLCGGTMITDRHILTAGHCVYNRNDLYLARVGEYNLYDDNDGASPEDIPLAKAKIHEDYSSVLYSNDIAILTLSKPPTNGSVIPVCLPHSEPYRSNTFLNYRPLVAGWGAIYFNGPSSPVLQVATVPVVKNDVCEKAFKNKSIIDGRILCAGWTLGGKDACQGDSGGPLMYGRSEGQNIRYYQIGVVSYGFRCAEAGFPGVYTRTTNFIDWIRRNID